MLNAACDASPEALAVVAWHDGAVSVGGTPSGATPNVVLRTFDGPGIERVNRAELVIGLEPQIRRFLEQMGMPAAVQMFRYVGTDGEVRQLLVCGSCGHCVICDPDELSRMHQLVCRVCSAVASPLGCQAWHSFGRCGLCPAADRPA